MEIPKAFISYSHDTLEHKKWVLELASRLRNNGIDAILDQFELQPGDDLPNFMEKNLANANKIIMVCTERYVAKANDGKGGVGYEKMIITSHLMKTIDENKVIPIIRQNGSAEVPTFLKSKLFINFSKNDDFEFSYDDLVRAIHKAPLFSKPPIGNNPFSEIKKEKLQDDFEVNYQILKLAVERYNLGTYLGDSYCTIDEIKNAFKISRIYAEIVLMRLVNLGYIYWRIENYSFMITDKGKLYAYENKLL